MADASSDLQKGIMDLLFGSADVTNLVADRIFDGGERVYPCITMGPSDFVPDDADCISGTAETVQIDCWVRADDGLQPTKALARAIYQALHEKYVDLADNALAGLNVTLVRCMMDKDGLTGHGIVQVEALIESNG